MFTLGFLILCLISNFVSFGMEERGSKNHKAFTVDLNDPCSFCLDPLSIQKGSIILLYCGHSIHGLCYVQWRQCKKQACYCGQPLLNFDEEGRECLKSYNNIAQKSHLQTLIALSKCCSRFAFDVLKHSYKLVDEMYSTAYNYNEE